MPKKGYKFLEQNVFGNVKRKMCLEMLTKGRKK